MDAPVNAPSTGEPNLPSVVLVVANGRQAGARRPLAGPLTLIGRSPDCEVRLNVRGVQPHHAMLVQGPDGFLLRNLAGQGVAVNGAAAIACRIDHGDVIAVGPFQLRLERTGPSVKQIAEAERDALRVQAAAVAAQQAALLEEEVRLRQRRVALEMQEEQLAGHLESRRRRLREIHEQMRREREEFQLARAAAAQEQAALRKEAQEERDAAAAMGQQVQGRRSRLMELRRRLRRREKQHWQAREAVLAQREDELATCENRHEHEAEKLRQEKESLTEARLRFNGDAELDKRRLREQWEELALAHQQWEACLNEEHAERAKRAHELDRRAAALDKAERDWTGRERSLRLTLADLHRECTGLETRVANQRRQLSQGEAAVVRQLVERQAKETPTETLTAPADGAPPAGVPEAPEESSRAIVLHRVAGGLADQRAHLLEQWQTLLRVQDEWRREREQALAGLETVARSLQEWEQWLQMRDQDLNAAAEECRQRQMGLVQMRHSLEGWKSRIRMRETGWETERAVLTAQTRAREIAAARVMRRLQEMARRLHGQRSKEAAELVAARNTCEELRQQYVRLWEECQRRRKELSREQRALAARTLAVEQARSKLVGDGPDAAKVQARLRRLERRNDARYAKVEREMGNARGSWNEEISRLNELARRVQRQQDELTARREELAREHGVWEERRAAVEDVEERRRLDAQLLYARHERDTHLIARLRDELERTVRLLMDEHDDAPAVQAA